MKKSAKSGFTLIELSIVLVIIGLLIGGILVGQSLISNAQVKKVIKEQEQYFGALRLFKSQFNGLPGDSTRAGSLLNAVTSGCCNDDGLINTQNETYQAWNQLDTADFIEDDYTGTHTSGVSVLGTNHPRSETFSDFGWFFEGYATWDMQYNNTTENEGVTQLRLAVRTAGKAGTTNTFPWVGPLAPEQTLSMDTKYDDGAPGSGKIGHHPPHNDMFDCTSGTDGTTAVYDPSLDGPCHVVFWFPDDL